MAAKLVSFIGLTILLGITFVKCGTTQIQEQEVDLLIPSKKLPSSAAYPQGALWVNFYNTEMIIPKSFSPRIREGRFLLLFSTWSPPLLKNNEDCCKFIMSFQKNNILDNSERTDFLKTNHKLEKSKIYNSLLEYKHHNGTDSSVFVYKKGKNYSVVEKSDILIKCMTNYKEIEARATQVNQHNYSCIYYEILNENIAVKIGFAGAGLPYFEDIYLYLQNSFKQFIESPKHQQTT